MPNLAPEAPLALIIPEKQSLAVDTVNSLEATFSPLYNRAADLMRQAQLVVVTDVTQLGHMETAKKVRLQMRTLRGEINVAHKAAKEESRKKGLIIDTIKNTAIEALGKAEDYLTEQENFRVRAEQAARDKLRLARQEKLAMYTDLIPLPTQDLADMSVSDFQTLEAGMESRYVAEKQRRELEELGRQAKEREEREKAVRLDQENKKLQQQQVLRAARQKILAGLGGMDLAPDDLATLSDGDFTALVDQAGERKKKQAADGEKLRLELAQKEQERIRLQKQLDEAAEKTRQDDLEKQMEKRQEQEAEEYSDPVKLEGVAKALDAFSAHIPKMSTGAGAEIVKKFQGHLAQSSVWLRKQATSLKQ